MQKVVTTSKTGYGCRATACLKKLLDEGYKVVHLTKLDDDVIEYIVEKDDKRGEK